MYILVIRVDIEGFGLAVFAQRSNLVRFADV